MCTLQFDFISFISDLHSFSVTPSEKQPPITKVNRKLHIFLNLPCKINTNIIEHLNAVFGKLLRKITALSFFYGGEHFCALFEMFLV